MKTLYVILCALLVGCSSAPGDGDDGENGNDGRDGRSGASGQDGKSGDNGNNGVDGEQGPPGPAGKNGTDNRIVKIWKCNHVYNHFGLNTSAQDNVCTNYKYNYNYTTVVETWYYATETSSGDMLVRSGVDKFHFPSSGGIGNSSTYSWKSGSWEASVGANWLLLDVCSGNYSAPNKNYTGNWEFLLNKETNKLTVNYNDYDMINNKVSFEVNCTN